MPKKQHRVVKKRIPREQQGRMAQVAEALTRVTRMVDALIEAVGQDAVRKANARLGSRRSLEALAQHVANGKLAEVEVISPTSCAVELSEHTLSGEVVTESVVAELTAIAKEQQEALVGAVRGDMRRLGEHKVQVRRVWDVVTP